MKKENVIDELKKALGINEWLELIKEDKNLNGAYVSIAQYIYLVEQKIKNLEKELESKPDTETTLQDANGKKYILVSTQRVDAIENLNRVNERLFGNWNKLKEYLKNFDIEYLHETMEHNLADTIECILDRMQELEQKDDSNEM